MNSFQKYETKLPDALREIGYEASWSDARPGNSFLMKILTRLGLLQAIKTLSLANADRIARDAKAFEADTVLLISPENLRAREIAYLRSVLPGVRLILYMWDSAANRHLDQAMIDAADRAFSFDIDDCEAFRNLQHVPLFHLHDSYVTSDAPDEEHRYDYTFIGTARSRRIKVLSEIERAAAPTGKRCFFYLFAPSLPQYILYRLLALVCGYKGMVSRESIPFGTYITTLAQSSCVIDVEQAGQGGLTIRTMDTVFSGRPLATTNTNIERYDFFPYFAIRVFKPGSGTIEVPEASNLSDTETYFEKYHIHSWLETILTDCPAHFRLDSSG